MVKANNSSGAEKAKYLKKTVVAVSGGFDPIHIGHIRLFQEAKKLSLNAKGVGRPGQRSVLSETELVVILNNDNWLVQKKGHAFMSQRERKEIIEALACVDRVVLTSHSKQSKDMSVCRELERIRPHVFANGGDRTNKNIPEIVACKAIGCKMIFGVGHGGKVQSSSWLLAKHVERFKGKKNKFYAGQKN